MPPRRRKPIPPPREFPQRWSRKRAERELLSRLVGDEPEIQNDPELQIYWHSALFDREMDPAMREVFYDNMIDYLWNEYGIDFEPDFDWISYRRWYDAQPSDLSARRA